MQTLNDLIDQLNAFQTPEELTQFFQTNEVTGFPMDCWNCPVANWIKRSYPEFHIKATRKGIYVAKSPDVSSTIYPISQTVESFMEAFDYRKLPQLLAPHYD